MLWGPACLGRAEVYSGATEESSTSSLCSGHSPSKGWRGAVSEGGTVSVLRGSWTFHPLIVEKEIQGTEKTCLGTRAGELRSQPHTGLRVLSSAILTILLGCIGCSSPASLCPHPGHAGAVRGSWQHGDGHGDVGVVLGSESLQRTSTIQKPVTHKNRCG